MKKIKIGAGIIIGVVGIYCIISYGIFSYKKISIDAQLQPSESKNIHSIPVQPSTHKDESVVVQNMSSRTCKHAQDIRSNFVVTNDEEGGPLAEIIADDEPEFIISADDMHEKQEKINSDSFISMKITDDYVLDQETQETLDILIGSEVDEFVRLILQSNNNIVSKEACRSCGMYAFFNGIKNHKQLDSDDIRMLQKLLANLYRFVEKTQKLTKGISILCQEQYAALEVLHKSQALKNDMKLQARRAATSAAFKKLQNIKYNK